MIPITLGKNRLKILAQPNDVSCGPTCLQAVYNYYGDYLPLYEVINDVHQVKGGGTLAVMLGNDALRRGYRATIYTFNIQVFDPTWFQLSVDLEDKLAEQLLYKPSRRFQQATLAYLQFLQAGGQILFQELDHTLLISILTRGTPILTGLSATYLYRSAREIPTTNAYDDVRGEPAGHFVVVCGYEASTDEVQVADPLNPNPIKEKNQYYSVNVQRLINSILLGIVTYDANLLIIEPM